MKDKEIVEMMGQIVTVAYQLERIIFDPSAEQRNMAGTIMAARMSAVRYDRILMTYVRAGWIVGLRYLQEGTITQRSGSSEDDDPGYLNVTRTVPAWQVAFWPTRKPISVPIDGFIRGGVPVSPSRWGWMHCDQMTVRQNMRQEMQSVKRDEKGRWLA